MTKNNILVGKWFHSRKDETINIDWQGQVLGQIDESRYLVQLYSWWDGYPTTQRIVDIKDMSFWMFYNSDEDMRDYYDRVLRPELRRKREENNE